MSVTFLVVVALSITIAGLVVWFIYRVNRIDFTPVNEEDRLDWEENHIPDTGKMVDDYDIRDSVQEHYRLPRPVHDEDIHEGKP